MTRPEGRAVRGRRSGQPAAVVGAARLGLVGAVGERPELIVRAEPEAEVHHDRVGVGVLATSDELVDPRIRRRSVAVLVPLERTTENDPPRIAVGRGGVLSRPPSVAEVAGADAATGLGAVLKLDRVGRGVGVVLYFVNGHGGCFLAVWPFVIQ